jgi:hypothetical protein
MKLTILKFSNSNSLTYKKYIENIRKNIILIIFQNECFKTYHFIFLKDSDKKKEGKR